MIPKSADKVFEGVLFDVYQWQQTLFDGSAATYEGLRRKQNGANMIVVTKEGTILYQVEQRPGRTDSYACLPCGGIEPGEDPLAGAKRELLEETGYASDDWELWKVTHPSTVIEWSIYSYVARGAKKVTEQALDPGERIEVREVTFDELLDAAERDDFLHFDIKSELVRAKYDPVSRRRFEDMLFKGGGAA